MTVEFSDKAKEKFDHLLTRYPNKRAALLPVLHLAQAEFGGWISPEAIKYIAELLDLTELDVHDTMSFYTMYYNQPMGKFVVEVCHTLSCELMGASTVVDHLENKLGIKMGETTDDGLFSLRKGECLGSCGTAPMMRVNFDYYENLNAEKLDKIIDLLRDKA